MTKDAIAERLGDYYAGLIKKEAVMDISNLKKGPIQHSSLPTNFIERVRDFKQALAEVENMTLEETLDNFSRDANPEKELLLWERIARLYKNYVSQEKIVATNIKREVFTVLLSTSVDVEDFRDIKFLTSDQIQYIVNSYRSER